MVSSVSNGLPQQIPAANTFQPGGSTENIREKESRDTTQAANASSTSESSRTTETRSEERSSTVSASSRDEDNGQTRSRSDRGSLVDVTV